MCNLIPQGLGELWFGMNTLKTYNFRVPRSGVMAELPITPEPQNYGGNAFRDVADNNALFDARFEFRD